MTAFALGGVVLAAGASRRMGTPKAFLEIEGRSFLAMAVELLRAASCTEIVVVCPPGESGRYRQAVGNGVIIVENPSPDRGMLSSLALGLDALGEGVTHAAVTLVDTPLISVETIKELAISSRQSPEFILVASHHGEPGHPVIYPRKFWSSIAGWKGEGGARGFQAANSSSVRHVEVPDAGVLRDFDSPADLDARHWREGFVIEE